MRLLSLTKVDRVNPYADTDEPGESASAPASTKVLVNAEAIRCFYARREGQPGTRITFLDGGGFAVLEEPTEVERLLSLN